MKDIEMVWIIDDDQINAMLVNFIVGQAIPRSTIIMFDSGISALGTLIQMVESREERPNIIFLDITMPIMSGFELLEEIFVQNLPMTGTKVYMYSSSDFKHDIDKAKNSKVPISGYIIKPITVAKLEQLSKEHPFVIG